MRVYMLSVNQTMMQKLNLNFSYSVVIFVALMIIGNYENLLVPLALAIVIHELGHVAAIILLGGTISSLTFNAGGLNISYNSNSFTYMQDVICALFGPLFGIFAAVIASNLGYKVFGGISLSISVFNLIPVRPLDGGRILWSIITAFDFCNAERIVCFIEVALITIFLIFSLYVVITTCGNLTLLFVALVLTFYYCKER